MKDSGIEWIGEIPDEWNLIPLKRIIINRAGGAWGEEPTENNAVICLRIADFDFSNGRFLNKNFDLLTKRSYSKEQVNKLALLKDDICIEKSGGGEKTPVGRAVIFDKNYQALFANFMDRLRVNKEKAFPLYVEYYLQGMYFRDVTKLYIKQTIGIQNLNLTYLLEKEVITLPPLDEQKKIADYLDDRCSKIDEIITGTTASIEDYKKLKQAVIAEVTIKGLNNSAMMKDTPFIWMGKIPKHWELKPFKYILYERNEKNNPIKSRERLSLSIDKGVTLYAEKTTNLDRFKDDFTAYKLAYEGDLVMNCMNMIVGASGVSKYFGCVSPVYYTYYDNEPDHIKAKYCAYLFQNRLLMRLLHSMGRGILSFDKGEDRVNTCRLKISRNDLRSLILPHPPLSEQKEIANYLDKKIGNIDDIITEKTGLIEDLKAYKKSLIYEVVTGKKRIK